MTLSVELFGNGMSRLRNAFNRTIPNKVIEGWYEEIKNCDQEIFEVTIKQLIREDHYPNLGQFWARYHECELKVGIRTKDEHGCPKCCNGFIFFIQYSHKSKVNHEVVGFCKECHPERKAHVVDPNRDFQYQPGMEPWKFNGNDTTKIYEPVSTEESRKDITG